MSIFEDSNKPVKDDFMAFVKSSPPEDVMEKEEGEDGVYYKGAWEENGKSRWALFKAETKNGEVSSSENGKYVTEKKTPDENDMEEGEKDFPDILDDYDSLEELELIEEYDDIEFVDDDNIKVFFAEDNVIFQTVISSLIERTDGMELLAWAPDGREAVEMLKKSDICPDVILMDINMPRLDGISAVQEILTFAPSSRVIMLTSFGDRENVLSAFSAGAFGYLRKDGGLTLIIEAIKQVAKGGVAPIQDKIAAHLISGIEEPEENRVPECKDPVKKKLVTTNNKIEDKEKSPERGKKKIIKKLRKLMPGEETKIGKKKIIKKLIKKKKNQE